MKRKLIQMAGKTLVISLPSDVVKKYGLKKGQELEVTEDSGKISVMINSCPYHEPYELKAKEDFLKEQLELLYIQGYDQVKVYYDNKSTLKNIIQNINKKFIGFQVLESNGKYCVIKSIAKEDPTILPNLIRRSFLILLNLLENDDEGSKENLTKLVNICKRILHQKNNDFNETIILYKLITIIEEINKIPLKSKNQAKKIIEQIYNLYYKFDSQESIKTKEIITKEFTTAKDTNKALLLYHAERLLELATLKNIQTEAC